MRKVMQGAQVSEVQMQMDGSQLITINPYNGRKQI